MQKNDPVSHSYHTQQQKDKRGTQPNSSTTQKSIKMNLQQL